MFPFKEILPESGTASKRLPKCRPPQRGRSVTTAAASSAVQCCEFRGAVLIAVALGLAMT
jgi:hypothetical protein